MIRRDETFPDVFIVEAKRVKKWLQIKASESLMESPGWMGASDRKSRAKLPAGVLWCFNCCCLRFLEQNGICRENWLQNYEISRMPSNPTQSFTVRERKWLKFPKVVAWWNRSSTCSSRMAKPLWGSSTKKDNRQGKTLPGMWMCFHVVKQSAEWFLLTPRMSCSQQSFGKRDDTKA